MEFTHKANPVCVNARTIVDLTAEKHCGGFMAKLSDGASFHIDAAMSARHTPIIGDYIVTQEDGYVYVNPKEVFERKYSVIPKPVVNVYSDAACVFHYCPTPETCQTVGCPHKRG